MLTNNESTANLAVLFLLFHYKTHMDHFETWLISNNILIIVEPYPTGGFFLEQWLIFFSVAWFSGQMKCKLIIMHGNIEMTGLFKK